MYRFRLGFFENVTLKTAADFTGTLVLGRPTTNSIAANLLAPTALNFYLEYGSKSGAYPAQTPTSALAANVPQEITLTHLQPDTRYFYRLRYQAPGAASSPVGDDGSASGDCVSNCSW